MDWRGGGIESWDKTRSRKRKLATEILIIIEGPLRGFLERTPGEAR